MMIKAVHLLWIIPAAVLFGIIITAVAHVAHDADEREAAVEPPTIYGYDLDRLAQVAALLQTNLVYPEELKAFCGNLTFAFDVVRADFERQMSATIKRVSESMTTGD